MNYHQSALELESAHALAIKKELSFYIGRGKRAKSVTLRYEALGASEGLQLERGNELFKPGAFLLAQARAFREASFELGTFWPGIEFKVHKSVYSEPKGVVKLTVTRLKELELIAPLAEDVLIDVSSYPGYLKFMPPKLLKLIEE